MQKTENNTNSVCIWEKEKVRALINCYGKVTDKYYEINSLIIELKILIDSYFNNDYDRETVMDCIFSSAHRLYCENLKELEYIKQCNALRMDIK